MFKKLFYKTYDDEAVRKVANLIWRKNVTVLYEVILPDRDPHLVDYDHDQLRLLDVVDNNLNFKLNQKVKDILVNDWDFEQQEPTVLADSKDLLAFMMILRQETRYFNAERNGVLSII